MKTNKISASEQFCQDIKATLEKYYRQALSESIKRGLAQKRKKVVHLRCKPL